MWKKPSLFKRLMLSILTLSFLLWCIVLAALIYQTKKIPKYFSAINLESVAHQQLAVVNITNNHASIVSYAEQNDELQRQLYKKLSVFVAPYHLQIWQGQNLIYSYKNLPLIRPTDDKLEKIQTISPTNENAEWLAWCTRDSISDKTVCAIQERALGLSPTFRTAGFYLIPFLVSVPFLILPIWWAISHGLNPLIEIATDIRSRKPSDLKPLAHSPYVELEPITNAINQLLEKTKSHLNREQEFLQDAAHELKTPLAVIQLNSELIANNPDKNTLAAALDGLKKGVARATRTTHQLLASARTDHLLYDPTNHVEIDFVLLLQDRLAYWSNIAQQKEISLELFSSQRCIFSGNMAGLTHLIDNLIDNAIKYSPTKSHIQVNLVNDTKSVLLEVIDQGNGIPIDLREKVFERFFRVNPSENHGTGLGLSIVKRVAENHGATIEFSGQTPEYCQFTVRVLFKK